MLIEIPSRRSETCHTTHGKHANTAELIIRAGGSPPDVQRDDDLPPQYVSTVRRTALSFLTGLPLVSVRQCALAAAAAALPATPHTVSRSNGTILLAPGWPSASAKGVSSRWWSRRSPLPPPEIRWRLAARRLVLRPSRAAMQLLPRKAPHLTQTHPRFPHAFTNVCASWASIRRPQSSRGVGLCV
jgi:hypothetical protein